MVYGYISFPCKPHLQVFAWFYKVFIPIIYPFYYLLRAHTDFNFWSIEFFSSKNENWLTDNMELIHIHIWLGLLVMLFFYIEQSTSQLDLCRSNCASADRLTGPTRMPETRDHPWHTARYPATNTGFCQLGCTIFFNEVPRNTTCKKLCGYFYRYKVTTGYSDLITEALLECQDGCDIGLQVCQAGFFCNNGQMLPCPAGTYREPVKNVSIVALEEAKECTKCPFGRYRSTIRGKKADDCNLCPVGYYVNAIGSTSINECVRTPAGLVSQSMGMRLPTCITPDSCNVTINGQIYFADGVDYYRETVPYIGRW